MKMKVMLTLTTDMLGTKPANEDVASDQVIRKAGTEEQKKRELESLEEVDKSCTTVFFKDKKRGLYINGYMFLGFLKHAGSVFRTIDQRVQEEAGEGKKSKKWGNIAGKMDDLIIVRPDEIYLGKMEPDGILERPIRCNTAQGPRVSVIKSEFIKAGTKLGPIEIDVLGSAGPISREMIVECLDYGERVGLGQWRNSGKGRFKWVEVK
jgi:hypothetical protein